MAGGGGGVCGQDRRGVERVRYGLDTGLDTGAIRPAMAGKYDNRQGGDGVDKDCRAGLQSALHRDRLK